MARTRRLSDVDQGAEVQRSILRELRRLKRISHVHTADETADVDRWTDAGAVDLVAEGGRLTGTDTANVQTNLLPDGWQTPTLSPGWAFPSAASLVLPLQFRLESTTVRIEGLVNVTTTNASVVVCELPDKRRPRATVFYDAVGYGVTPNTSSQDGWCRIQIDADGTLFVSGGSTIAGGWLSLSGITFATR